MQNSSTCDKATQTKVSSLINIKSLCSIQLAKLPNLNRAIVNNKLSTTNTAVQPRCVVNKFCTFCKKVNLESPYGNILEQFKSKFQHCEVNAKCFGSFSSQFMLFRENDFPKKDEPTDDDSSTLKGSSENSCFDNFKDSCSVSSLDALSFSDEDNSAGGVGSELTATLLTSTAAVAVFCSAVNCSSNRIVGS
ncbi:hypothetical protein TYRP_001837 [Tyrophagus putrescentiae]|nr:hypothetical protein TYRP_001837 [Tyrophagus putrescentiae]